MTEELKKYVITHYEQQPEESRIFHPGGFKLTDKLAEEAGIRKGSKVLDIASGKGATAIHLAEKFGCEVVGIDLSEKMVQKAKEEATERGLQGSVKFWKADAENLPFGDGTFDAVLSECSVCLFPNKEKAISEMARVVRPGGKVAITDVVLKGRLPDQFKTEIFHAMCIAGAETYDGYARLFEAAGLKDIKVVDYWWAPVIAPKEVPGLRDEIKDQVRCRVPESMSECCSEESINALVDFGVRLLREKIGYGLISGTKKNR
ncbi:MAG: class I SAM-dependent methyltransferase [Candidatus Bathyarchaeia archaeon]